jgi:hypothetical protein
MKALRLLGWTGVSFLLAGGMAWASPIVCHCCGGIDPKWCAIFWICC